MKEIPEPDLSQARKEVVTDLDLALFWIDHIEDPCEREDAPPKEKEALRDRYCREALKAMRSMKEENAKRLLELVIKKYKGEEWLDMEVER